MRILVVLANYQNDEMSNELAKVEDCVDSKVYTEIYHPRKKWEVQVRHNLYFSPILSV